MSMFALVFAGAVVQRSPTEFPVNPSLVWTEVTDVTPAPQVGWAAMETNGVYSFAAPPAPPAPSLAQQASAALSAGLTVTATGPTMTMAAVVFPTDPATTGKIAAVITAVNTTGAFPGGASSYPMKDASGTWHTFTLDQYKAVAAAIAGYAASLDLIIDGNPLDATALPAGSITLTV